MDRTVRRNHPPEKARTDHGRLVCPKCGKLLGKAYYGAEARGIELWCGSKGCQMPVLVEL